MSWINSAGEVVIFCNNNKNSYYTDPIGGTVFIRKDYLELISKSSKLTNRMYDVLLNENNIEILEKYMQRKFEEGDMAKAYKEVGTMLKIISDARQEMLKSLNTQKSGKNARIALKFTNDSGDDFQLGVDL